MRSSTPSCARPAEKVLVPVIVSLALRVTAVPLINEAGSDVVAVGAAPAPPQSITLPAAPAVLLASVVLPLK